MRRPPPEESGGGLVCMKAQGADFFLRALPNGSRMKNSDLVCCFAFRNCYIYEVSKKQRNRRMKQEQVLALYDAYEKQQPAAVNVAEGKLLGQRAAGPFYVTECGLSCNDHMFLDGQIHDTDRSDFLHRYLLALHRGCDRADVHSFSTGRRPTILSGTAAMPSASV